MEFSLGPAVVAGLIAMAGTVSLLYLLDVIGFGVDLPWKVGASLVGGSHAVFTYGVGFVVLYAAGALTALLYAWLLDLMGAGATWGWGTLLGLVHGAAASGVVLWARRRRRLPEGDPASDGTAFRHGALWLVGHVAYGALVGFLYGG